MSTDYDLTPTPAAGPRTQPPAGPATTAQGPATIPNPRKTTGSNGKAGTLGEQPADGTLGGVIIPGAALASLIGLCWLIHQFGLTAVILAVLAAAAAATAALAVKVRRNIRRPASRGVPRTGSRAGPTGGLRRPGGGLGSRSTGSGARSSTGRTRPTGSTTGNRTSTGSRLGAGKSNAGKGRGTTGSGTARKPSGLGTTKPGRLPAGTRPNRAPKTSPLGKGAAATGGTGRGLTGPRKTTPGPLAGRRPAANGYGKGAKGAGSTSGSAGIRSLLRRATGRPTPGGKTRPGQNHKAGQNLKKNHKRQSAGTGTRGAHTPNLRRKQSATPAAINKGLHKAAPKRHTPTSPLAAKAVKQIKALTRAARHNRGNTATAPIKSHKLNAAPKTTPGASKKTVKAARRAAAKAHRAHQGPARRVTYWAGKQLRNHTSRATRRRVRRLTSPARTTLRALNRTTSPVLAHTWRYGTRALLHAHMALGTVRYTNTGPNWARPLAKVFHALTTPAARTLAWTGTWGWLNRWMYTHTAPPRAKHAAPLTYQPNPAPAPTESGPHRPVTSPATSTSTKGTPVSIEAAAPFQQAAEVIRQAAATMAVNPAESMRGYEATITTLAEIQDAVAEALDTAANVTEEAFKVNPAIAEAYRDSSNYARSIADRVEEIQGMFRSLHEEQIDNYENPTPQGAKWDTTANN